MKLIISLLSLTVLLVTVQSGVPVPVRGPQLAHPKPKGYFKMQESHHHQIDKSSEESDESDEDDDEPIISTYEMEQRLRREIQLRYQNDMERIMKFVFGLTDLKNNNKINQHLLVVSPWKATLKCMEPMYERIVRNVALCENAADEHVKAIEIAYRKEHPIEQHQERRRGHQGEQGRSHHAEHEEHNLKRFPGTRRAMPCSNSHEVEMHIAHEIFVGQCFINSLVATTDPKTQLSSLDEAKMKQEINSTTLAKANKDKTMADLHTCLVAPRDVTHLVELMSGIKSFTTRMIHPMLYVMYNNQSANVIITQTQSKLVDMKKNLYNVKGMICLVESLAKNGCGADPQLIVRPQSHSWF